MLSSNCLEEIFCPDRDCVYDRRTHRADHVILNLILNAEALRPPITGIGNYTFHLLQEFVSGDHVDEVHCFSGTHWLSGNEQLAITGALKSQAGVGKSRPTELAIAQVRAAIGKIPGTKALYSSVMDRRFALMANRIPAAVYHETNYVLKPFAGPCVTTVHDFSHIRYPQFHPAHVIQWLEQGLARSLQRADCIITVSNLVRDELLNYFDVPEEKVKTVYEGVQDCYRPRAEEETSNVLQAFELLHKQYVLLVATLEPRKGIDVLLDAWCLLPESLRRQYPLVLTGSKGWRNKDLIGRIEALIAGGTVRHLGYVPAEILPVLYSGAAAFVYPSVYEGFGLPVLDAMSSAVPVICRAGTSMAEFAEGACLLCETGDPQELALKIGALLESNSVREHWGKLGQDQAARFSWERCAAETAEIYRLVS
jgi:glycosyltransferase involved in cell wall biosynthesis